MRDRDGSAATEMALVTPLLLALMFGSAEVGNYFLNQHALTKQVRDGARYASRLTLSPTYDCPDEVFADPQAEEKIANVTKTGTVNGTGTGRFPASAWSNVCPGSSAIDVSVRCVPEDTYEGIYSQLDGDIPVVKVSANIDYESILGTLGFNTDGYCLRAESEIAVAGL